MRAHSQPRIEIMRHQQAQQRPVRYAVLIAAGRIVFHQFLAMRQAPGSAVQEKRRQIISHTTTALLYTRLFSRTLACLRAAQKNSSGNNCWNKANKSAL